LQSADRSWKITEAIRRYGITKGNVDVVVVKIGSSELQSPAEEEEKVKQVIDGTLVPFTELRDVTDWSSIKKVCVTDFSKRPIVIHPFLSEVSQA
jgi:tRNA threonylcarbamoyladenosine modification (KEOPS) complex Cgi121 subunit